MPRPKGCRCPKADCPVHPGRWTDEPPASVTVEQTGHMLDGAKVEPERPKLRAVEGGRRPDPKPKAKPKQLAEPTKPDGPTDSELTKCLAELLVMPAIPAAMVLHCDFCRDHFLSEGPKAARELVALSITNPPLRGALESMYGAWSKVTIGAVIAGYLLKPMAHHLAPNEMLKQAGVVMGVPPRPEPRQHAHAAQASPYSEAAEDSAAEDQYEGDQAA